MVEFYFHVMNKMASRALSVKKDELTVYRYITDI